MQLDFLGGRDLKLSAVLLRDVFLLSSIGAMAVIWIAYFFMSGMVSDDPAIPDEDELSAEDLENLAFVFVLITVGNAGFLVWRYLYWSKLLNFGVELRARVMNIEFEGEVVSLRMAYSFDGREVNTSKIIPGLLPLHKRKLSIGDEVSVLVNSKKPESYLLLEYYFKPQT